MRARSRKPYTESLGIESSNVLASSRLQRGVLPFLRRTLADCANFTPLIPLRSYSANNDSRRFLDTSTRPRASRLEICPASAANVMKFFYDISASSNSGARRDAYHFYA
jgi:hypothetical protein